MKNAPAARSNESALEQRRFYTDNPRHCRALALLLQRPAAGFIAPELAGWLALLAVVAALAGWQ